MESHEVSCVGGKTHNFLEFRCHRYIWLCVCRDPSQIACEPNCAAHFIAAVFHQLCSCAITVELIY